MLTKLTHTIGKKICIIWS